MAIRIVTAYPGKTAGANANYPDGEPQNVTSPGDGTGTPWEAQRVKDIEAFLQGLLIEGSVVASGSPDTVLVSDLITALKNTIQAAPNLTSVNIIDKIITSGAFEWPKQINEAGLSGTVNDLVLTDQNTEACWTIVQAAASSLTLTGITAPDTVVDDRIVILRRDGSAGGTSMLIQHETTSAAANQFSLPGGEDITVREGEFLAFKYNTNNTKWELLFRSAAQADDLLTDETDTAKRLAPDGAGGVEWVAGGSGGLAVSTSVTISSGDAYIDVPIDNDKEYLVQANGQYTDAGPNDVECYGQCRINNNVVTNQAAFRDDNGAITNPTAFVISGSNIRFFIKDSAPFGVSQVASGMVSVTLI